MKREIYLETTPLNEAIEKWLKRLEAEGSLKPFSGEKIQVKDSLGRITSEPVIAKLSSPFYHSSAMDGYAVRYVDTFGASETSPKKLKLKTQAVYVDTGDPIPDEFNAVVMIEDVNVIRAESRWQRAESSPPPPPRGQGGVEGG
ncbi:MAG: molybdopterin molybdenumtransferase MoeA, partial [Nitrospirota bacterium]